MDGVSSSRHPGSATARQLRTLGVMQRMAERRGCLGRRLGRFVAGPVRGAHGERPYSGRLPITYVARHGETGLDDHGQHTGLTDLPLTRTRRGASGPASGNGLKGLTFGRCSRVPCGVHPGRVRFAGFARGRRGRSHLVEWNYGEYEAVAPPKFVVSVGLGALPRRRPGGERPGRSARGPTG